MSLWAFVCSVLLCNSVRKRTHPLYEMTHKQLAGEYYLSRRTFLSLTELTDLTEPICALFRSHRRPSAYRIHRTLLLKMGVTFCAICRPQGLCEPCVFCSSVFFCEKEKTLETCRRLFSLTEHTEFTESFSACFEPTRGGDSIYLSLAKRRVNGRGMDSCGQKNGIKMC